MIHIIVDALRETVSICLLVMLMMTLIEVFNVTTKGKLFNRLSGSRIGQVVLCSLLGVLPGCLGGALVGLIHLAGRLLLGSGSAGPRGAVLCFKFSLIHFPRPLYLTIQKSGILLGSDCRTE